jgi:hypothetical protein
LIRGNPIGASLFKSLRQQLGQWLPASRRPSNWHLLPPFCLRHLSVVLTPGKRSAFLSSEFLIGAPAASASARQCYCGEYCQAAGVTHL